MGSDDLHLPDGTVLIPPDVARELLRPLVVGLAARCRADGTILSPRTVRLLHALHNSAEHEASSEAGTPTSGPASVEVTATEAARIIGCSAEYARRLARTGRITGRRAGPAWLINRASLDAYRHGDTMPPNQRTANLGAAVHAHYEPARQAQDAAQQAATDRAAADATLYGTAAWDALPANRKTAAQQHALTAASKETSSDAA